MKILTPINNINRIEPLVEAGADEFYFGFANDEDFKIFGEYFELNRMSGFRKYANRFTYDDTINLIKEIRKSGKDSYATINSSGYTQDALNHIEKYIAGLINAGVTGIIVSCPEVLDIVNKHGGNSVISCVGAAYNANTVRFFQKHGAKRIIVPRDLSIDEIEKMKRKVPDMEYETFIMRNGCILSDGNCLGLHQFEHGGICNSIRKSEKQFITSDASYLDLLSYTHSSYDKCLFKQACSLCGIYRMIKIGITACKMVGRVDKEDQVLKDMILVKKNREIALNCETEREYFNKMVFPDHCEEICKYGYNCYFPEIVNHNVRA